MVHWLRIIHARRLLGPVSDLVLIDYVSKGRELHQVINYSHGTILIDCRPAGSDY